MDIKNKDMSRRIRLRGASARPSGVRRLRGQAMVLFLVLVGVLCLGAVLMFNTGQTVNKKVRLTHAADAAAYSVAVQQARAMNFAAYMNRGRIANEVAVAQLVSLWSWMNMLHTHTVVGHNLWTYLNWLTNIPPLKVFYPVTKTMVELYKAAEKGVANARKFYHPIAEKTIKALDGMNGGLAEAADVMLEFGGGVNGYLIAGEVVGKNDPTAKLAPTGEFLLINQLKNASAKSDNLFELHKRNSPNPGMDRFRNVVMGSRDRLSADRFNDTLSLKFPGVKIGFEQNGGTDMVQYNRWVAVDTLDISAKIKAFGITLLDLNIPLGFGGAQALESKKKQHGFLKGGCPNNSNGGICSGGQDRKGKGWYSDYHPNNPTYEQYNGATHSTAKLVNDYPSVNAPPYMPFFTPKRPTKNNLNEKKNAYFRGYQGLRNYYDVKEEFGKTPEGKEAGPIFTVFVESKRNEWKTMRTSEDIDGIGGPAGGQLELKSNMNNSKMTAIASAQTYFNRPSDPGSKTAKWFRRMVPQSWNGDPKEMDELEMGSVFSPYWQARLVETPIGDYRAVGIDAIL